MVPVNILKDKVIADATETAVFQHSDPKKLVLVSSEALYEAKYNNDPNLEAYMPDHIVRLIPKYNVYKRLRGLPTLRHPFAISFTVRHVHSAPC